MLSFKPPFPLSSDTLIKRLFSSSSPVFHISVKKKERKEIDEEAMETVTDFILGAPKSLQMLTAAMKFLKDTYSLEGKL